MGGLIIKDLKPEKQNRIMYEDIVESVRKELEKEPIENAMDWYIHDFLELMIITSFFRDPTPN